PDASLTCAGTMVWFSVIAIQHLQSLMLCHGLMQPAHAVLLPIAASIGPVQWQVNPDSSIMTRQYRSTRHDGCPGESAVWVPRSSTPSLTKRLARLTVVSSSTRPSTMRRWRGSLAVPG